MEYLLIYCWLYCYSLYQWHITFIKIEFIYVVFNFPANKLESHTSSMPTTKSIWCVHWANLRTAECRKQFLGAIGTFVIITTLSCPPKTLHKFYVLSMCLRRYLISLLDVIWWFKHNLCWWRVCGKCWPRDTNVKTRQSCVFIIPCKHAMIFKTAMKRSNRFALTWWILLLL